MTDHNTIEWQRAHWRSVLASEVGRWETLGYAWGDPHSVNDPLGNYAAVLRLLRGAIGDGRKTVLEIGSYGGKWTQHMLLADRVVCCDLFCESDDVLLQRFGAQANIEFHVIDGRSLNPVGSETIDVVFSMDSLVRAPLDAIYNYLEECHRVMRPGSVAILHLPCTSVAGSVLRKFTPLESSELMARLRKFTNFHIDYTTLVHGALVTAWKL